MDPEPFQAVLDAGAYAFGRPEPDPTAWIVARGGLREHFGRHLARKVTDVVAVVAVLRDRLARAHRQHRRPEVADLRVEVVEVVLACHLVAGRSQHARQEIAHERAPCVADV